MPQTPVSNRTGDERCSPCVREATAQAKAASLPGRCVLRPPCPGAAAAGSVSRAARALAKRLVGRPVPLLVRRAAVARQPLAAAGAPQQRPAVRLGARAAAEQRAAHAHAVEGPAQQRGVQLRQRGPGVGCKRRHYRLDAPEWVRGQRGVSSRRGDRGASWPSTWLTPAHHAGAVALSSSAGQCMQ
jgi:hypothetical protein